MTVELVEEIRQLKRGVTNAQHSATQHCHDCLLEDKSKRLSKSQLWFSEKIENTDTTHGFGAALHYSSTFIC